MWFEQSNPAMTILDLSPSESAVLLEQVLSRPESRHLEFKRVSRKMVNKALETLCAFANTEGGVLVLGLADLKEHQGKERLFGIEENPEAVDELLRLLPSKFHPPLTGVSMRRLNCTLHNGPCKGKPGNLMLVTVLRGTKVHSLVGAGTYERLDAGNAPMTADAVTELSYRRGVRSATAEPVAVPMPLLQTQAWQRFLQGRAALTGSFEEQLLKIGLADWVGGSVQPKRAAVLLFADDPGSLLAAHDSRADVRVMVYDGKHMLAGSSPNFRKPPKTIRGPLIDQIDACVKWVMDALAEGVVHSGSGFVPLHAYPERVVKEAIVNAIIHRDYRLNRDIFVRIFDDRIEVESPGVFPGNITPANIAKAGSRARNPLLAANLREFPVAPNIDAGEGVRMMFAEMAQATLYPPQYRQNTDTAVESVTVTLFNAKRPSHWDEVSDWVDRHGTIANADVVRITGLDTLKASKWLALWREQGVLVPLPGRAKRNMAYTKPGAADIELGLLSGAQDINEERK
jgi:ATP-dependent DNA helicase RecG